MNYQHHYNTAEHAYYYQQQQHDDEHEQEEEEEEQQDTRRNSTQNNKTKKRLCIKSHQAINKPKRKRITPYQFSILSDLFSSTDTPNYQLREKTAEKLNMTNREVQVWFQNRRAKVNRNKLQDQKRQHDPFIYPLWNSSSSKNTSSTVVKSPPSPMLQSPYNINTSYQYQQQAYYNYYNNSSSDNELILLHQQQHQQQQQQQQQQPVEFDSQSSVTTTTTVSSPSTPTMYPQLLPQMRPLDILALAAEYVARCDEEKRLSDQETRKCWRPWD